MAVTCLGDAIGIKGECGTQPTSDSGFFVQDLQYITIPVMDAAIASTHASGFERLQEIVDFASRYVGQMFAASFDNKYIAKTLVENSVIGQYKDDQTTIANEATYLRGIQIVAQDSPYLSFFVSSVSLQSQATGSTNVVVWDLISNKLLDTIAVSTTAGEVSTTAVNKTYSNNGQKLNLFIGHDADTYETNLLRRGSCSTCNGGWAKTGYIRFSGRKVLAASDKIDSNLENSNGSSGLSLQYSLNCEFDNWLCAMKNRLALPMLYKIGELVLREVKTSQRLNGLVLFNKAQHTQLIEYYEAKYMETSTQILSNLSLPRDKCFKCKQKVRMAVTLP